MALQKHVPSVDAPSANMKSLKFSCKSNEKAQVETEGSRPDADVDIDLREVYFLIMHFLSTGPCQRTYGQFWNELLEHNLLPRRYHSWYSRTGAQTGDENDSGSSLPLSYTALVERYPHIGKDHLVKLLKQLLLGAAAPQGMVNGNALNAAAVPTLLGTGSFSLLGSDQLTKTDAPPPRYMRWPHMQADQVRGLGLREIGGGFTRHHRAPSIRAACYAIAKPSTMVQKMQNIKKLRGHRNAVYCAIFDRSGRYVITGSDDRLVKIWSMETAYCLASCRGHEGDITDLAVNFNNTLVASASNDCIIRVWRLPDGLPISVLRGHSGAVTAIAFSPRLSSPYQLLSSSDDGSCRIWDARYSQVSPRVYVPRPPDPVAGKNSGPSSSTTQQNHQIFCCAFNSNGTVFVTGSSDTFARVWNACKPNTDDSDQPSNEMDVLAGHENDVNYVQFSGCAVASRILSSSDALKEDNNQKFRNTWFTHDNIVTCSRDGSAIIWIPRSRRSHVKAGRWTRAYHLKVPPPPLPPQPPRGGPRQRILPTPRGVNMIIWSLDNRFVLAAIMDCRICVWNAVDGSLVHSLTGHTESTYVLDVHPFNPRIAMSAGYDGKTIVWDIWEGTPIRIYEMGRWKLVDGKFSSDGTSIILSDDVGQLYILNTGQGESQKDAKYDQFFLGDYRPLVQDAHGNVLDQETQLAPYRRNMQDLLCDSAMIPYPEPYQSMFQGRRLGALGIEWRPSSVRFAVGPDISLDQEYQMLPIADLDILIDPIPELLDAMDWEPEIEVHSDDNDAEYIVPDEIFSEGEQGSLSCHSSGDHECCAEDSETENAEDRLRRSKRKKLKVEVTSSGRRVKRKNMDEYEDNSCIINRNRKCRNGRKASKKKSSSKNLRPQRAAALNALNFLSQITGTSTDADDEEGSLGDTSESESLQPDSNIVSEESDDLSHSDRTVPSKGKEVSIDESETVHPLPESHMSTGNRKRLVLKLPNRNPNKLMGLEKTGPECTNQANVAGSSSSNLEGVNEVNRNYCHNLEGPSDIGKYGVVERSDNDKHLKFKQHFNLLEGCEGGNIRWGGVKNRTSKRSRLGDPPPSSDAENIFNETRLSEAGCTVLATPETQNTCRRVVLPHPHQLDAGNPKVSDEGRNNNEHFDLDNCKDCDRSPEFSKVSDDQTASVPYGDGADSPQELKEDPTHFSTKLCIRSRISSYDLDSHSQMKISSVVEEARSTAHDMSLENPSDMVKLNTEAPDCGGTERPKSECGFPYGASEDADIGSPSRSTLQDFPKLKLHDRMFSAVYRRSKTSRARSNLGGNSGGVEPSTSNSGKLDLDEETEAAAAKGTRRTRSTGLGSTADDSNIVGSNTRSGRPQNVADDMSSVERNSSNGCDEPPVEEDWRTNSRGNLRLRSTRNRRPSYHIREATSPDRKKSHQVVKSSWLMLTMHEEGSRYIPQLGDEIAYLRQGHEEFISESGSKERAPWRVIKGNIRAVEFCKVEELEYSAHSGSGESCCRMTLKFVDPASNVVGKSFKLTLPEVTGFPDFLVERTRYEAAIARKWTCRDKCQVWWKNEGEEDGSWWDGRILSVKPKSAEFPESPWERYMVQYKSEPTETHGHSPWELYDADTQWEQPQIDVEIRDKLLTALVKLEQSGNRPKDPYGVHKLKQVSQKSTFVNRFPVPVSIEVIKSRLENNYYRGLQALRHDVEVMLSNAETYFGKNPEISTKMKRLTDWFTKTLSSL